MLECATIRIFSVWPIRLNPHGPAPYTCVAIFYANLHSARICTADFSAHFHRATYMHSTNSSSTPMPQIVVARRISYFPNDAHMWRALNPNRYTYFMENTKCYR